MKKPYVVAIAGCSASGKSTLVNLLMEDLKDKNVVHLSTDKFFQRPLPKMISPLSNTEYDDYNCPESLNYEADLEAAVKTVSDESIDVVLLEGLTVLYFPKIRELADLKIYLDLDAEIRMYRRIVRNLAAGRGTMDEIADFYLNSAKYSESKYLKDTKLQADIVLNGHNFQNKGKEIVELVIRTALAERE